LLIQKRNKSAVKRVQVVDSVTIPHILLWQEVNNGQCYVQNVPLLASVLVLAQQWRQWHASQREGVVVLHSAIMQTKL
jgi:hypothetical protein